MRVSEIKRRNCFTIDIQEMINSVNACLLVTRQSEKPEFRYVVGSDAVILMQARKNMPYSAFQQMIQKIVQ